MKQQYKNNLLSYNNFRAGSAWIILVVGIVTYVIGYFFCEQQLWKDIFIKIGDVLIIGVLIGYLSNASEFLGVFKSDLQDIIYGKEFLKQKKDVSTIWETVSKVMLKDKFPQIHNAFFKVIKDYFPSNEVSFYNDYDADITIEWDNEDNSIIKVTHQVSFDLIAEDSSSCFNYPLKTLSRVVNGTKVEDSLEIKVNGKTPKINDKGYQKEGNQSVHERLIELSGSNKYSVSYTDIKTYPLDDDYTIGLKSKYIINGLKVNIEHPQNIDVTFLSRGTQEEFEDIKSSEIRTQKRYKGIILPKQGYIIALRKKS